MNVNIRIEYLTPNSSVGRDGAERKTGVEAGQGPGDYA